MSYMSPFHKLSLAVLLTALIVGGWAFGHSYSGNYVPPITFNPGDTLTAAGLNQAINHVHNTFGNIVDGHLASNAAISHSKMAVPALLPKAAAVFSGGFMSGSGPYTYSSCSVAGSCALNYASRITSVTRTTTAGNYDVTLSYTPVDPVFGVVVTAVSGSTPSCSATNFNTSAPHFRIICSTDVAVQVVVMDDSN